MRMKPIPTRIVCNVFLLFMVLMTAQGARSSPERKQEFIQVTTHPDIDLSPRISPDGKWMAYVSRQTYNYDIWVRQVSGGRGRQVTFALADDFYPVWYPDGRSLVFVSQNRDAEGDLWRVRLREINGELFAKGAPERLTDYQGFDGYPAVSANGGRIAFVSNRSGRDEIWLYDHDKLTTTQLTYGGATHPCWNRRRDLLAFTSFRDGSQNHGDIWMMDLSDMPAALQGKEPGLLQLTHGPDVDGFPSWSPDGNTIVFLRFEFDTNHDQRLTPSDQGALWAMSLSSGKESAPVDPLQQSLRESINLDAVQQVKPLTSSGENIMQPWFGGDQRIYFTSDRGGNLDIWSIPADGPVPRLSGDSLQAAYVEENFPLESRATRQTLGPLFLGFRSLVFTAKEQRSMWDRLLALRRVIDYFPADSARAATAIYEMGQVYALLGFDRQAEQSWQLLAAVYVGELRTRAYAELALLGLHLSMPRRPADAAALQKQIETLLSRYPGQREPAAAAQVAIGDLYFAAGDPSRAFNEYAKVQTRYPEQRDLCAASQLKIGDVFKAFAQRDQVIKAYLAVVEHYPDQRQWMVPARDRILALLTEGAGDDLEQISRYREIIGQYQSFQSLAVEAQLRIAQILFRAGQYQDAAQEYEVVESLYPSLIEELFQAQSGRGEALLSAGENLRAFTLMESMEAQYRANRPDLADRAKQQLIDAYLVSADQLRSSGDLELASLRYQAAWKLDLQNLAAHRGFLECKYYLHSIDDAIIEYRQLNSLHPANNILMYALGLAYSYKGTEKAELDGDPDGLDPRYLVSRSGGTIARALAYDYTLVPAYLTISFNAEMMENYEARQRSKPVPFAKKIWRTLTAPIISVYHNLTFYEETKPVGYYERAIHELEKALVLNDETADPKLEASLALNLANNYYNLGEFGYEKAYEYYLMKLKYDSTFVDPLRQALIFERMGHCALVTEDLKRGPVFLSRTIELYKKLDKEPRVLLNLKRLALLYEIGGQNDMAIEYYQRAAEIEKRNGDWTDLMRSQRSIAYNYLRLKEPADAIRYARAGMELLQSGKVKLPKGETSRIKVGFLGLFIPVPFIDLSGMSGASLRSFSAEDEQALMWSILGDSYQLDRDYRNAVDIELKKIEMFRKRKDSRAIATTYNHLGYLYFLQGSYDTAWDYFRRSLRLCEKHRLVDGMLENSLNLSQIIAIRQQEGRRGVEKPFDVVAWQKDLDFVAAKISGTLRTIEESEAFYSRERCILLLRLAELTLAQSGPPTAFGMAPSIEETMRRIDRAAIAKVYLDQARQLSSRYGLKELETSAMFMTGELYRSLGDADNSLDLLLSARRTAFRQGFNDLLWRLDLSLGDLHASLDLAGKRRLGVQKDALEYYLEAVDVLESQGRRSDRLVSREAVRAPYLRIVRYLTVKGDARGALIFAERMRAKDFLDLMNSEEVVLRKERHKIFFGNARFLQEEINKLNNNLLLAKNEPDITVSQTREWQKQRSEYQKEYEELIARVRVEVPELENLVRVNPVEYRQIQNLLAPSEALLYYQPCDSLMMVWTMTHEDLSYQVLPVVWRPPVGLSDFSTAARADSQSLVRRLLAPAEAMAGRCERLIIIADGPLLQWPWSALVGSRSAVTVSSSLTAYHEAMQKRKIRGDRIFVADDRTLAATLDSQKYDVVQPVPGQGDNSFAAQVNSLANADLIHLRVESEWNIVDPLQTRIGFRVTRSAPAIFTFKTLFSSTFAAALMVLGTDQPVLTLENEFPLLAMERGLHYAGVPAILLPLWPGTAALDEEFYAEFYRQLQQSPPAQALTAAQRHFRDLGRPFEEWGRFQLYGFGGLTAEQEQQFAVEGFEGKVRRGHSAFDLGEWSDAIRFYQEALVMAERQKDNKSIDLLQQRILESAVNGAQWTEAIKIQSRMVAEAEKKQDIGSMASGYNNLAFLYTQNGQIREGVDFKSRYARLAEQYGLSEEEAKSLRETGLIYERGGQPDKALEYFVLAKSKYESLNMRLGQAQCLRDIGRIYFVYQDNYIAALQAQEQALAGFAEAPVSAELVDTWQNLGLTHEKMGNYRQALACQQRADSLAGILKDERLSGLAEQYLANLCWKMGDFQTALKRQNRALEVFTRLHDDKLLQVGLATRGLIALSFNQPQEALQYEQQALDKAMQNNDRADQATIHKNIGMIRRSMGHSEEAVTQFMQAAFLDSSQGSKRGLASDWRNLADLYRESNHGEALQLASRALRLSEEIGDGRNQAQSQLVLGALLAESARDSAMILLQQAAHLAEDRAMPDIAWRAYQQLAGMEKKNGQIEAAIGHYRQSLEIIESLRANIRVEEYAAGFIDDKQSVYADLIDLLAQEARYQEALQISEQSRSRSFLDMLGERPIKYASAEDDRLMAVADSLRALLNRLQTEQLYLLSQMDPTQAQRRRQVDGEVKALRREFSDHLVKISEQRPELADFIKPPAFDPAEIRRMLPDSTGLLEYHISSDRIHIWLLTREKIRGVQVDIKRADLDQQVATLRSALERQLSFNAVSRQLYRSLIEPVEADLTGLRHLVIAPHDRLHYLPFAVLQDGSEQYLGFRFTLSTVPSAGILLHCMEKGERYLQQDRRRMPVLAFGNPELADHKLDLPYAEREVRSLQRYYPDVRLFTQRQATETRLWQMASHANLLEFSCHGVYDEVNPMLSALLLTPDEQNDGRLEAHEIFNLDLNAYLVAMSACESGLGALRSGDEMVGLSRSFIYAGSASLLSSLWKVDDLATAVLMKRFFRYLAEGHSRAEALRMAQRLVHDQINPYPAFWAGFILTGDFR